VANLKTLLQEGVLDVLEDACNGLLSNILSDQHGRIDAPTGAIAEASKAASACATVSAQNAAARAPPAAAQRPVQQSQPVQQQPIHHAPHQTSESEQETSYCFFEESELASCDACGQRLKAPVRCNVLVCPNCKHHVRASNNRTAPPPQPQQSQQMQAQRQGSVQQQQQQQQQQQMMTQVQVEQQAAALARAQAEQQMYHMAGSS
jgi:hypothetical protein